MLRDHLLQVEKTAGKRNSLLDKDVPPSELQHVWDMFWRIRKDGKLLCSEVLAYRELTGAVIDKFELHEMLVLDDIIHATIKRLDKARK